MNTHEQVIELLPWYVNETLAGDDLALVERHVGECLPCRRALHEERRLQAAVGGLDIPSRETAGLSRLLDSLDAKQPARARTPGRRALAGVAGLAAAACAGLIAFVVFRSDPAMQDATEPPADFSTLSLPAPAGPLRIDVVFTETAPEIRIRELLTSLGASADSQPSAIGRYTIELAPGTDVDALLDELTADPAVRFAGLNFLGEDE